MNIIKLLNNTLFKQYELKVEDYLFTSDNTKKQATILFKPRLSRCKLKVTLDETVNNENYIKKIHPYDCYVIGILNRILLENVIPKNTQILKIKHNNEKISPHLRFSGIDYNKGILTFKISNSNTMHNITITDFIRKISFIVIALSSIDALQLGFIITDYLIDNGGMNLNG